MKAYDIKKGNVVEHNGTVYQVRDIERSAPQGRGGNVKFRFTMYSVPGSTKFDLSLGGEDELNLPGLEHLKPLKLGDYLIGRYEVSNRAFKRFVDAGGYERRDLWKHRFVEGDRELSWDAAMARFTDRTGRRGPAGWEAGSYPEGQADYPVTGVSWYEAAAYAELVFVDTLWPDFDEAALSAALKEFAGRQRRFGGR